jgi:hypothetical protein
VPVTFLPFYRNVLVEIDAEKSAVGLDYHKNCDITTIL